MFIEQISLGNDALQEFLRYALAPEFLGQFLAMVHPWGTQVLPLLFHKVLPRRCSKEGEGKVANQRDADSGFAGIYCTLRSNDTYLAPRAAVTLSPRMAWGALGRPPGNCKTPIRIASTIHSVMDLI